MKYRNFLAILLAALLVFSAAQVFADETAEPKKVRVGYTVSGLFFNLDETGQPVSGYGFDYLETIAAFAGWDVEYIVSPGFSDSLDMLRRGEVDVFYDVSYTPERAEEMIFTARPMGSEDYYLYCMEDNQDIHTGDYASMDHKRVGVTAGTVQIQKLREWCAEKGITLDITEYVSVPEKEAALRTGVIDMDLELNMQAGKDLSAVAEVGGDDYYIVVNRNRPDLAKDINLAYGKIISIDRYYFSQLNKKYYEFTVVSRTLSADESSWIAEHPVLNVGYLENYLPLSGSDDQGQPTGLIKDVLPMMFSRLSLEDAVTFRYTGYQSGDELYEAAADGIVDIAFPALGNITFAKEKGLVFSAGVFSAPVDLVYKGTYADDKIHTIAVNRNSQMQEFFSGTCYPGTDLLYFDSIDSCLSAVARGTADATILNGLRTSALLRKANKPTLKGMSLPETAEFRFAVKAGNSALLSILNRGNALVPDASVIACSYDYIDPIVQYTVWEFIQLHPAACVLTLVLFLLLLTLFLTYKAGNRKLKNANILISGQKAEIQRAMNDAERANRSKTEFLFNMSHDVRTPLNAILGYADMGLRHVNEPERVQDNLHKVKIAGGHLLSLINDILEMSRIESGNLELSENPMDLRDTAAAVEQMSQALAIPRSIDFTMDMSEVRNPYIYADELHVNEVLINLISNAVKFTEPGGTVTCTIQQSGDPDNGRLLYRFEVKDTGIGMSEEFQKHLFEAFSREKTATVSQQEGAGLGLSITKRIVDLAGGIILVDSAPGKGSTFTVEVSLRCMDRQAIQEYLNRKQEEPEIPGEVTLEGKRILLVEDNEMNREIAQEMLEEAGLAVETAENGAAALEKVTGCGTGSYDFILMDIQMPVMDGYEATKAIRALPGGNEVPIIALSANTFAEDVEKSLEAGMNAHVAKPIDMKQLFDTMRKFAGWKESEGSQA